MRICIARRTSRRCFPASKPTISRPCRPSPTLCAKPVLIPRQSWSGPDAESRPWVSDLAGRLGLAHTVAQQDPPRRPLGRDRICRTGRCIAGRPALIVDDIVSSGGTLIACAKALTAAGATAIDAIVTHALFPRSGLRRDGCAGIRSIRSTYSVPHPTNAIALDELFVDALKGELSGGDLT